jgi:choline-sulfatase
VDVVATMLDLAGFSENERQGWRLDGKSLRPVWHNASADTVGEVFAEYTAHGTDRARAMLRSGRWKLCYNHGDPPEFELYDLASDPGEFTNLADEPALQTTRAELFARLIEEWEPDAISATVLQSQRERWLIRQAQSGVEPLF